MASTPASKDDGAKDNNNATNDNNPTNATPQTEEHFTKDTILEAYNYIKACDHLLCVADKHGEEESEWRYRDASEASRMPLTQITSFEDLQTIFWAEQQDTLLFQNSEPKERMIINGERHNIRILLAKLLGVLERGKKDGQLDLSTVSPHLPLDPTMRPVIDSAAIPPVDPSINDSIPLPPFDPIYLERGG